MFIQELAEPQLLVIYPGRFQPFHKGHHAVYEWLTGKFGRNNVYIATSNKTDTTKSPFDFAEKKYFMQLTGVPDDRIIQAAQPYQIENILSTGQITVADPSNTVVIFAVSQKDMAEDPRFSFAPKKDGSEPYFQPLRDIKQTVGMDQHGYIMTVPTFDFNVAGDPMQSSTELRAEYKTADAKKRQLIIQDLFGRYSREAEQIMNNKLSAPAQVPAATLGKKAQLQKVAKPEPMAEQNLKLQQHLNTPLDSQSKQFSIQGYRVIYTPVGIEVYKGADLIYTKKGDYSNPTKANLQSAQSMVGAIIRTQQRKKASDLPGSLDESYMSSFMTAQPKPMDAKEQWKRQIRALISQYANDPTRLADLAREKGPDSAEAYAYKYIANPTARIPLPPGVTECGGTGVIANKRQARDPRYSTSLTKDVRPGQIGKNLRAFKLAESNIDLLAAQLIDHINQDIDAIKQRFATEKLPAEYKEMLKNKIEQLKARRHEIMMGR